MKYYKAHFIMRKEDPSLRKVDIWSFKSDKSGKRYIVEVEYFNSGFKGLKFYWKGVKDSKERYSLLTHDNEPRTIIMSCIYIMLDYYNKDPHCSFGFVAAPDLNPRKNSEHLNKRFRFYRRMMLSVFGNKTFYHGYDLNASLYVLINHELLDIGSLSLESIEEEISNLYEGDYSLSLD